MLTILDARIEDLNTLPEWAVPAARHACNVGRTRIAPVVTSGYVKQSANQRRGRDSNPRWSFPHTAFPVLHNRPLCHLSDEFNPISRPREPSTVAAAAPRSHDAPQRTHGSLPMHRLPPSLVPLLVPLATPTTVRADEGFKPLFNGKALTGWSGLMKDPAADPAKTFLVEDGLLRVTGKPNGYLATMEAYGDYVLRVKWRWVAGSKGGNSGVRIHVVPADKYWPQA